MEDAKLHKNGLFYKLFYKEDLIVNLQMAVLADKFQGRDLYLEVLSNTVKGLIRLDSHNTAEDSSYRLDEVRIEEKIPTSDITAALQLLDELPRDDARARKYIEVLGKILSTIVLRTAVRIQRQDKTPSQKKMSKAREELEMFLGATAVNVLLNATSVGDSRLKALSEFGGYSWA